MLSQLRRASIWAATGVNVDVASGRSKTGWIESSLLVFSRYEPQKRSSVLFFCVLSNGIVTLHDFSQILAWQANIPCRERAPGTPRRPPHRKSCASEGFRHHVFLTVTFLFVLPNRRWLIGVLECIVTPPTETRQEFTAVRPSNLTYNYCEWQKHCIDTYQKNNKKKCDIMKDRRSWPSTMTQSLSFNIFRALWHSLRHLPWPQPLVWPSPTISEHQDRAIIHCTAIWHVTIVND